MKSTPTKARVWQQLRDWFVPPIVVPLVLVTIFVIYVVMQGPAS